MHQQPQPDLQMPALMVRLLADAPAAAALPARAPAPAPATQRSPVEPAAAAAPAAPWPDREPAANPAANPAAESHAPGPSTPPAVPATAAAAAAPAMPAAAPPRQPAIGQVHYLVAPPAEVPRASRRAGEHGTVWLRVRVSAEGLPTQITLHRSSGFARLDEQALWAMRQARFRPSTENGLPVEMEVIAPIEYATD